MSSHILVTMLCAAESSFPPFRNDLFRGAGEPEWLLEPAPRPATGFDPPRWHRGGPLLPPLVKKSGGLSDYNKNAPIRTTGSSDPAMQPPQLARDESVGTNHN